MNWYERVILPRLLDAACSIKPIRRQRAKVVPRATGDVLEIGIGSGLNLPFYDRSKVSRIIGLEPSAPMRERARATHAREAPALPLEFIDLPGEEIPLADHSVDTVLVTYTLCTIPEPERALAGMRRVLRPGGRLIFCEHARAPDAGVARWQDRLNRPWRAIAGGCNMNRDMTKLLTRSGFSIDDLETMYLPGPRILSYNVWGSALVNS